MLQTLLHDDTGLAPQDSVRYTGFHYVDWRFDGADDIVYAVRTGYRGANSYHNSNFITFKRLADFRAQTHGLLVLALRGSALSPPFERDVLNYTATLPANATEIQLAFSALDDSVLVSVDGSILPAGASTAAVPFPTALQSKTIVIGDGKRVFTVQCARARPGLLSLSGSGFTIGTIKVGAKAWMNRGYVWVDVPAAVSGSSFTRIAGGAGTKGAPPAKIRVDAIAEAVTVYATLGDCKKCSQVASQLRQSGWVNS